MPYARLYVENEADESLARILFASEAVTIKNGFSSSGAQSAAETALAMRPAEPVALLLSSRVSDPVEIDGLRASIHFLILRAGTMNYFVALAVPRVLDWLLSDPKLRRAFEASPQDMKIYHDRAARVAELARTIPFDPSQLEQQCEDYRGLVAFIRKHAAVSPAAPSRAS